MAAQLQDTGSSFDGRRRVPRLTRGRLGCALGGAVVILAALLPWTHPQFKWQSSVTGVEFAGLYTIALGALIVVLAFGAPPMLQRAVTMLGSVAVAAVGMTHVSLGGGPEGHPPLPGVGWYLTMIGSAATFMAAWRARPVNPAPPGIARGEQQSEPGESSPPSVDGAAELAALVPELASLVPSLAKVSIRGRMAYATACIELLVEGSPRRGEFASALRMLRDFCSAEDLGWWDSEATDLIWSLKSAGTLEQRDGEPPIGEAIEIAYDDLGRGNLYAGIVGESKATLDACVHIAHVAHLAGVRLPDVLQYSDYEFAIDPWGPPFVV